MSRVPIEADYRRALVSRVAVEFRTVRLFTRNVGLLATPGGGRFRAGIPGQADLYAVGQDARHYEIELKRFTKLSPAQVDWADWCQSWGVPWVCLEVSKRELLPQTIDRWMCELAALWGWPRLMPSVRALDR